MLAENILRVNGEIGGRPEKGIDCCLSTLGAIVFPGKYMLDQRIVLKLADGMRS